MTIVKEQHKNDNYYINLEMENNHYNVQVYPLQDDNLCGYPIRKMIYSINDKQKAYNTFKRYKKKYI